jgi:hypothetical protein
METGEEICTKAIPETISGDTTNKDHPMTEEDLMVPEEIILIHIGISNIHHQTFANSHLRFVEDAVIFINGVLEEAVVHLWAEEALGPAEEGLLNGTTEKDPEISIVVAAGNSLDI